MAAAASASQQPGVVSPISTVDPPAPESSDGSPRAEAEATSQRRVAYEAHSSRLRRWYGYQTLAVDLGAAALFIASVSNDVDPPAFGAIGIYALGTPIVHALHDNSGRGAGSLLLRIALPSLAWGVGANLSSCKQRDLCRWKDGIQFAAVGLLLATMIDAMVFAYDDPPNTEAPSHWSGVQVTPLLGKGHAELGVSTVF